ncbi:MAG: molybdopterin-dependent oxidoreductase [Ktedonobacteraceae bacterium]
MKEPEQNASAGETQPSPLPTANYPPRRALLLTLLLAPGAGLAASLLAVVVMGILSLVAGIATPVELFGDYVLKHIDVHTFIQLLNTFAPNSKTAPLGLALLAMLALGTVLGWLYAALVRVKLPTHSYRPTLREWLTALILASVMTLVGVLLFWDELRQNRLGLPLGWASLVTALALLVDFSVYAVSLCLIYRFLLPRLPRPGVDRAAQNRRQLLARAGVVALSAGAGAGTLGLIRAYLNQYAAYDGTRTPSNNNVTAPITPNSEHYVVTQNTVDPTPDITLWRLEVNGLVNKPGTYTYEELQKLPSTSRAVTMECISNGLGDHLMGTAIWQGVSLRTLLALHGNTQPGANYAVFYSVDGYNISLPLAEVLAADPILAWRMNGVEIPLRHGYPLRVLIPGRYGEESPKWLTRVELTDHSVPGLYASQGWYNGPLHTTSRIDHPRGKIALSQPVEIGGIAFSGDRGIQKVEVSVDGALTWKQATLDPLLSPDAWVFWKLLWQPTTAGTYTLAVRATDGQGQVQTGHYQSIVPGGVEGYHEVKVVVE